MVEWGDEKQIFGSQLLAGKSEQDISDMLNSEYFRNYLEKHNQRSLRRFLKFANSGMKRPDIMLPNLSINSSKMKDIRKTYGADKMRTYSTPESEVFNAKQLNTFGSKFDLGFSLMIPNSAELQNYDPLKKVVDRAPSDRRIGRPRKILRVEPKSIPVLPEFPPPLLKETVEEQETLNQISIEELADAEFYYRIFYDLPIDAINSVLNEEVDAFIRMDHLIELQNRLGKKRTKVSTNQFTLLVSPKLQSSLN